MNCRRKLRQSIVDRLATSLLKGCAVWLAVAHSGPLASVTADDFSSVGPLPPARPSMRSLESASALGRPPSKRALIDARKRLQERFGETLSHTDTAVGARLAVEILMAAATEETDPALRWLLLDEGRRLGAAVGSAETVTLAVKRASAFYEFDALEMEFRSLTEIPIRALSALKATQLAETAESLATRAETDRRLDLAARSQNLAVRAWQRAGNPTAARTAAIRHDLLTAAARQPQRRVVR